MKVQGKMLTTEWFDLSFVKNLSSYDPNCQKLDLQEKYWLVEFYFKYNSNRLITDYTLL